MRTSTAIALVAAAAVGALVLGGREEPEPFEGGDPVTKKPPKPIVVGQPTDAGVAPFIAQLGARFIGAGVNLERVPVVPLIEMSKAPGRPVAVPPLELWDPLARIASVVDIVISQTAVLSAKLPRLTGYRPSDYNAAVGGAPASRHIFGDAIDVWVPPTVIKAGGQALRDYREALRMAFARWVVRHPQVGWGFGVYTNDIHIDAGRKPGQVVTWEQGGKYIAKAKAELGIA